VGVVRNSYRGKLKFEAESREEDLGKGAAS